MPRPTGTLTVSMGFNPKTERVRQLEAQAREKGKTLSAYVKELVFGLVSEGRFIALRFKRASQVSQSLAQEAESLEMSIEDYIQALLADRHRALYEGSTAVSLWFPKGQPAGDQRQEEETAAPKEEEVDLDEAMQNVSSIMDFYNEEGF